MGLIAPPAFNIFAAIAARVRHHLFCCHASVIAKLEQLFPKKHSRLEDGVSRRPASFTQADVARVLRAAQQVGVKSVELKVGDASVVVSFDGAVTVPPSDNPWDEDD